MKYRIIVNRNILLPSFGQKGHGDIIEVEEISPVLSQYLANGAIQIEQIIEPAIIKPIIVKKEIKENKKQKYKNDENEEKNEEKKVQEE